MECGKKTLMHSQNPQSISKPVQDIQAQGPFSNFQIHFSKNNDMSVTGPRHLERRIHHGAMAPATQMRLLRLLGHGRNSSSCCLSSRQDLRSAATSRNVLNVYNICIIQNRSYIKDQIPQLAWPSALTSIRVRLPAPQKGNYNLLHSDCGSKNLSLPRCPEEHQCHVVRLGPWQCAEIASS